MVLPNAAVKKRINNRKHNHKKLFGKNRGEILQLLENNNIEITNQIILMKKYLFCLILLSMIFISCDEGKKEEPREKHHIYIIGHEDDRGKYGEGTYLNTNSEKTCPHCGMRVLRRNIMHDCQGTLTASGGGNQYSDGYDQGQEDAASGADYNPSGYGGNGQFEKGYEDGYNDY